MPGAELEQRLEQLAAWIVAAHARGERYGLKLGEREAPPDSGNEHRDRCLDGAGAVRDRRVVVTVAARSSIAAALVFAMGLALVVGNAPLWCVAIGFASVAWRI